jgi:hypothetical protein
VERDSVRIRQVMREHRAHERWMRERGWRLVDRLSHHVLMALAPARLETAVRRSHGWRPEAPRPSRRWHDVGELHRHERPQIERQQSTEVQSVGLIDRIRDWRARAREHERQQAEWFSRHQEAAIQAGQMHANTWQVLDATDMQRLAEERRVHGWAGEYAETPPPGQEQIAQARLELFEAELAAARAPSSQHQAAMDRVDRAADRLEQAELDREWAADRRALGQVRAGQSLGAATWENREQVVLEKEAERRAAGWQGRYAETPPEDQTMVAAARQALHEQEAQVAGGDQGFSAVEWRDELRRLRAAVEGGYAGDVAFSTAFRLRQWVDAIEQEREAALREGRGAAGSQMVHAQTGQVPEDTVRL